LSNIDDGNVGGEFPIRIDPSVQGQAVGAVFSR